VFCGGTLSVAPIATGNVFVASSLPNPFHNRLDLTFTLPQAETSASTSSPRTPQGADARERGHGRGSALDPVDRG
jgi:hypothetical protein